MKVHIEDNLFLESDGIHGCLLRKYGTPYKNNKDVVINPSEVLGYYTTIQNAVVALLRMKLMQSTATTLEQLVSSIEGVEKDIREKIGA